MWGVLWWNGYGIMNFLSPQRLVVLSNQSLGSWAALCVEAWKHWSLPLYTWAVCKQRILVSDLISWNCFHWYKLMSNHKNNRRYILQPWGINIVFMVVSIIYEITINIRSVIHRSWIHESSFTFTSWIYQTIVTSEYSVKNTSSWRLLWCGYLLFKIAYTYKCIFCSYFLGNNSYLHFKHQDSARISHLSHI